MGTSAITRIVDADDTLVCIYRHFDGDPASHGADLKRIAGSVQIINGHSGQDKIGQKANGIDCLAAQVVAGLKDRVGNIYLIPADSSDETEYAYTLSERSNRIHMRVVDTRANEILYEGPLAEFDPETANRAALTAISLR